MVCPVAGTPGSSQVELVGQWGCSGHTMHLRRQKRQPKVGVGPCETLISLF